MIVDQPEDVARRRQMVEQQLRRRGIGDPHVLDAMESLPRQAFVESRQRHHAYDDCPLPIGQGQTISQPYIVALMSQALALRRGEQVLEIGTGCGYQTAILALLADHVFTIEYLPELSAAARARLAELELYNISYHVGDGRAGWPGQRRFDAILVAAAAPSVPEKLWDQLALGGRMVIPLGQPDSQVLQCLRRTASNEREETFLCYCRFVPLVDPGAAS